MGLVWCCWEFSHNYNSTVACCVEIPVSFDVEFLALPALADRDACSTSYGLFSRWVAVSWTDNNGAASPWADWAYFGTGLMTQAEWAPSAWISCPMPGAGKPNYNQLRAEFNLNAPAGVSIVQARMYITGMGYYSAAINGQWARQWESQGPDRPRLDPGWTVRVVAMERGSNVALWHGASRVGTDVQAAS